MAEARGRFGNPTIDTVGAARTNVPGLEGELFAGGSPRVYDHAGLPRPGPGTIASPGMVPQARDHAEQDIANRFVAAVQRAGLRPSDLEGRELVMRIQNPSGICNTCRQGLNNPNAASGVLKQLSERYPGLSIRVIVDNPGENLRGPKDFTIRNGAYVR